MSSFLQTTSGDLDLGAKQLQIVTDPGQEAAQKLRNLFLSVEGEWFLDQRLGIPYFDYIFVKNPDLGVCGQIFREVLRSCPRFSSIEDFNLSVNPDRSANLAFKIKIDTGQTITGGTGQPFIVTPTTVSNTGVTS